MKARKWWLPDGMDEWLPPDSWELEGLRRQLLDRYRAQRYELMLTPLLEHLDALLTGTGSDLEQQTFKLVDPADGRMLGLRADMTPQAARVAARRYPERAVVRLCYLGTVLRASADSPGGPRSPRQVGCELFGDARISADLEILRLMLETLEMAGVRQVHLDLGHAGVYSALIRRLKLDPEQEICLFDVLQRKSQPDLQAFAAARRMHKATAKALSELMDLNGGPEVLKSARQRLNAGGDEVAAAIEEMEKVQRALKRSHPRLPIHVDLAELRGYRYQTGLVFAAFVPEMGREIARGGRYDGVGREFGVARPATGFSADLNELLRLGHAGRRGKITTRQRRNAS